MASKVTCSSCGWSWNKSDSSKKDTYICHQCGKNNTMKNGGWLDNFAEGGTMQEYQENYNDAQASVGPGFVGYGYDTTGRNYSPAWGGQFAMGGSLPGAVGFTYARTQSPAPSNGPYAKKTKASAQNGKEMQFYQNGLDWKPNGISQNGKRVPTLKEISQIPDKKYQPSNEVMQTKGVLAGLSMLPIVGYPASLANSVYDFGTGLKYAIDGQSDKATEDISQGILGLLPTSVAIRVGMKGEKIMKQLRGLKALKAASDIKTISETPTGTQEITRGPVDWFDAVNKENNPGYTREMARGYENQMKSPYQPPITGEGAPYLVIKKQDGGVIEDSMGQWNHPGEITRIPSNNITMQGVDYPVLGISDIGDTQLMQPGKDYKFKGKKVTEYPIAQNGWLTKYK